MPNAGALLHQVQLISPNADGGTTAQFTVRAAVRPLSSAEMVRAGIESGSMAYRVEIRHRAGIRTNWRVKYLGGSISSLVGRELRISGFNNYRGKSLWLGLQCFERMEESTS